METENSKKKQALESLEKRGFLPGPLAYAILSTGRSMLCEDDAGKTILNDTYAAPGEDAARCFVNFWDSDVRSELEIYEIVTGHEYAPADDEVNNEWISEAINEESDILAGLIKQAGLLTPLETEYPGFDWNISVGYGEGIFGIELIAEPNGQDDEEPLSPTETLLRKVFLESTGAHMLDSGGAYGRHWERNQKTPPWTLPEVTYEASRNAEGRTWFDFTVSLYSYLTKSFTVDEHLQKAMGVYDRLSPTRTWFDLAESFGEALAKHTDRERVTFNTYNESETWNLSQVFQAEMVRSDVYDSDQVWIVQIHQGCDVRGGYSRPVVLRPKYDDAGYMVTVDFTPGADADEMVLFDWSMGEWSDREGTGGEEEFQEALNACEIDSDGKLTYQGKPIEVYVEFQH